MIVFLEGALGSGKSMECMARVVEELIHTNRFITTNMPLKLPEMHKLFLEKFGEDFNMHERIRILTNEECFKFWLHPAPNYEISDKPEDKILVAPEGGEGNQPVLRPNYESLHPNNGFPGALILIDECPEYFDAEMWKSIASDCKHFLRNSRKLEADCIFVAQDRGQIAKPLRVFAQKTIVLRNLGYERIGIFRAPDKIYWSEYFKTPDHSAKPQASGIRSIDKKWLGAMYDTSAGVGLSGGRRADTKRRKKGLHIGYLLASVVLGCFLLLQIPRVLGWAIKMVMPPEKKKIAVVSASVPVSQKQLVETNIVAETIQKKSITQNHRQLSNQLQTDVCLVGMIRGLTGHTRAYFSDGSMGDDWSLGFVADWERRGIMWNAVWFPLQKMPQTRDANLPVVQKYIQPGESKGYVNVTQSDEYFPQMQRVHLSNGDTLQNAPSGSVDVTVIGSRQPVQRNTMPFGNQQSMGQSSTSHLSPQMAAAWPQGGE